MTTTKSSRPGWLAGLTALLLAATLIGMLVMWPHRKTHTVVALFSSAVGLYPGDDVRVVGVPVGKIESVEPRAGDVKVTMSIRNEVQVPADARAILISPNLVAARFVQITPPYDSATRGATLSDGGTIGLDRTGVPVEWDEVKRELTDLSAQLGPKDGGLQGPLTEFVNQAATTFDGNGDSFRNALHELSQTAGRLGDSSGDLFGTVKNLQILINALSQSNEQIVQFSNHVASVSQVLAESSTGLDNTLGTLNTALGDVRNLTSWPPSPSCCRTSTTTSSRSCMSPRTAWPTSTTSTTRRRAPLPACSRCRTSPIRSSSSAVATSRPARIRTITSAPRSAGSEWRRCFVA